MREYTRPAMPSMPPTEEVDVAVEVFRMLGDGTRLRLLWLMREGEVTVQQLTAAVGKPQGLVSQHLAKLRMTRLVSTRRHGNRVYYRLANDHVAHLVTDGIHHAQHAGPGVPEHHQPGGEHR